MELLIYLSFFSMLQLNAYEVLAIRISQKKCDEYRKEIPLTAKVFNEEDAAPKEFPFMARIDNVTHLGNGILISKNFILTTANTDFTQVILGDSDYGTDEDDARPQRFDIIDKFRHPKFNDDDRSSNIQLLKLSGSVKFDEYVRPACLSQRESEISKELLEIGWGDTNVRNNGRVHKVQLSYVSVSNCKETYNANGLTKFLRDIDSGQIFCAAPKKGEREIVSGFGSAVVNKKHDSLDEIIGITSFDCVCSGNDSNPMVSVRVASYIDWIERIVWSNETVTTVASTTKKIETKIEETTTHKFQRTTKPSTTNNTTDTEPITTKKVEISTDASTTIKKVVITAEAQIDTTTERPTTDKVYSTTGSSTTDNLNIITTAEPNIKKVESSEEPTIHKVEITTESSTTTKLSSTTMKQPPQEETKSFEVKYILIIAGALLLILCAVIACFQVTWCRSTKTTKSVVLNVQCHM